MASVCFDVKMMKLTLVKNSGLLKRILPVDIIFWRVTYRIGIKKNACWYNFFWRVTYRIGHWRKLEKMCNGGSESNEKVCRKAQTRMWHLSIGGINHTFFLEINNKFKDNDLIKAKKMWYSFQLWRLLSPFIKKIVVKMWKLFS